MLVISTESNQLDALIYQIYFWN